MGTNDLFCCVLCLFICFELPDGTITNTPKHPVVIVPGDGGSQFEAKLDKPTVVHRWCTQKSDNWFPLWLNLELMGPFVVECFADNMRLVYDRATRTTHNSPGVQTRQPGFGNTSTVEWLDSSHFVKTEYFYYIVQDLVDHLGYERGVSIRGAPYDFRKAPNDDMKEYLTTLQKLVEDTYQLNQGRKVVLLGHSMGCLYSLYFLNHQPQAWKDKYIQSMITLAGPWGGAVKVMRLMASGDNLGVWVLNPLKNRVVERTMTSSAWLLPYDTFWNRSEVLVHGPVRNYTVNDYQHFFKDLNFTDGFMMRQDTEKLIKSLNPPNVEVHCLHGYAVDTPASFKYSESQWSDSQPDVKYGDGDGTVNTRSLHGCLKWSTKQKQKVYHQEFKSAEHMEILTDEGVLAYLRQVLGS